MIELYSGTPGSGKSYHATERVYYWLRDRKVIANYELQGLPSKKAANFIYKVNADITPAYLIDFAKKNHVQRKESQTMVVIDEAGIKFNCRSWQDKDRLQWLDFFSQHRKYGFDIILIAQADVMLDKQIRQFIENDVNHRKLSSCGVYGKAVSVAYKFVAITFWYGNRMRIGAQYIGYRKKIANLYNSWGTFNEVAEIETNHA